MFGPTVVIFLFCATFVAKSLQSDDDHIIPLQYQWKALDFAYESQEAREKDIQDGTFYQGNISAYQIAVSSSKVFLTIPRTSQLGVPVTIGSVPQDGKAKSSPKITPYPSWDWHRDPEKCKKNRLVSVHAAEYDACGRLWVLDTGKSNSIQICRAQIVIFDTETDQMIGRYTFPEEQILPQSALASIVVEVVSKKNKCKKSYAYIGDINSPGLIVYDYEEDQSWRIEDNTFNGTYNCIPSSFTDPEQKGNFGILGMAVGTTDDYLYYTAICSKELHYVDRKCLRKYRTLSDKEKLHVFQTFSKQRKEVSISIDIDEKGRSFFDLVGKSIVSYWKTDEKYDEDNFHTIQPNIEGQEFFTFIRVYDGTIWVFTKDYRIGGYMNDNVYNFKLCKGNVKKLLKKYGEDDDDD